MSQFDSLHQEVLLDKAWTYFKLKDHKNVVRHLNKIQPDTLISVGYYPLWLRSVYEHKSQKEVSHLLSDTSIHHQMLAKMFRLTAPSRIEFVGYGTRVKNSYTSYYRVNQKNASVAVALASMVPGLGKYYIGKKKDGISSFLTVGVLGVQFVEAYLKGGLYNW
ncbi:MAG TPA: hypothetical protein VL947_01985, partial [Cytophagales bacterium]|nr:hypothetical protein [Cytophagales bacterium]